MGGWLGVSTGEGLVARFLAAGIFGYRIFLKKELGLP